MNKITALLCLIVLLFSACKKNLYNYSNDLQSEELEVEEVDFEYLTAKVKIVYQDGKNDLKGTTDIRIKKDSIIWFSASKVGIEGVRGIVTTDSLVILDKIKKTYSVYNFDELSELFQFNINYQLIQSAITGNLTFPYEKSNIQKLPEYFNYQQKEGKFLFDSYIGRKSMKVEKLVVKDMESQNTLQVVYENFQEIDEQILPFKVFSSFNYFNKTSGLNNKTIVNIVYNKASVVKKPLRFSFRIPQKYEKK